MTISDRGAGLVSAGALGEDELEAFHRDLTSANITRLRVGAVLLVAVEALVVVLERVAQSIDPSWQLGQAGQSTTAIQVAMIAVAAAVVALLRPTPPERIASSDRWATLTVLAAWICLAASIPGFRHEANAFAWPYLMVVVLASMAVLMTWREALCLLGVGYAVYVATLVGNQVVQGPLLVDLVEGTATTIIGFLVSRAVYANALQTFSAQRLLERQRQALADANEALGEARCASDALLRNVLPGPVADRLKSNKTVADCFDQATVLFGGVVDFTSLCQGMPPEEAVRLLDTIFSAFDDLAGRHGLVKIRTIGDAYMATSGLPTPRPDHARAAALMCLDMRDLMPWLSERLGVSLELRLGMASGPAVAGVIGQSRLTYDLWGDTVNSAFRMEAHGVPGEIQVTQATYDLLRDDFLLEEHDEIEMNGRGPVKTYLLKGRRRRDAVRPDERPPASSAAERRRPLPSYWNTAGWHR